MTSSRQSELRNAFEDFQRVPFPLAESDDDEIDALRADLAEYDGYIAGIVSTVVGHGKPRHALARNHELAHRLESLLREKPAPAAQDARRLLDYLNALHALIGLAEASQEAAAVADLDAWNRWWRRRGEPGLRALLMALWDPIGWLESPKQETNTTTTCCR